MGYVLAPGRLAALVAAVCMGLGGVAVALRPHDTVSRAAAAGAVVVSGLMAVALRYGWVEPRRADVPLKLDWRRILCLVALYVSAHVVGRQHGLFTRWAVGADSFIAVNLMSGLFPRGPARAGAERTRTRG